MEGIVQAITSAEGKGKAAGRLVWSIRVNEQSYGAGFRKPDAEVGDTVRFDVVADGRFQNAYRIERVSGAAPAPAPPQAPAPAPRDLRLSGAPSPATLLAAAVLVAAWAQTSRPLDWGLEEFANQARALARKLET